MNVETFYAVLSGICFALSGLWWTVVEGRKDWLKDAGMRGLAGGVYASFLIPGVMALGAQERVMILAPSASNSMSATVLGDTDMTEMRQHFEMMVMRRRTIEENLSRIGELVAAGPVNKCEWNARKSHVTKREVPERQGFSACRVCRPLQVARTSPEGAGQQIARVTLVRLFVKASIGQAAE